MVASIFALIYYYFLFRPIGSVFPTIYGVIGFLIILLVICCYVCPCCIVYKRRNAGIVYRCNYMISFFQQITSHLYP